MNANLRFSAGKHTCLVNAVLAVTDFFEEFGGGELAALQDLLLIKSIWTEFPRVVPSEVLRKD